MEVSEELLKSVFLHNQRHANYKRTVELAKNLRIHADGIYPGKLIDERRPSESLETKEYRKKIYKPITKSPVSKIISSIGKIRRSPDWMIRYEKDKTPAVIQERETLEAYCEQHYPLYTSVTNWVFSELLRRYLLDANAVVAVIPRKEPEVGAEYVQPSAMVFDSAQLLDYEPGNYAVLCSSETVKYATVQGRKQYDDGKVMYVITDTFVARYEQSRRGNGFDVAWSFEHHFGSLPVFKVGGLFLEAKNNDIIYESRIAGILPHLDEAVREYSDLQAEILQHIHSEKYVYVNRECSECRGTGTVITSEIDKNNPEGLPVQKECPKCHGIGSVRSVTPYGIHEIAPQKVGELAMPTPPIGYIEKQTDIARLQDERVDKHVYKALSAINMEFLMETPLSQSGVAKEVDKDELNNLVGAIAEDIVAIMDRVYYYIGEYRYSTIVRDEEKRRAMLPHIPVPERFDLLNSSHIMNELATARTAGVNPVLIRNMEIEYAKKKFNADPSVASFLQAVYALDPLAGLGEDEKMSRLNNGGITKIDYIVSCNIEAFVQRAVYGDPGFYSLPFDRQRAILMGYAEEINAANGPGVESGELKVES
jgi:hypothetical protein